jgi:polysaccharide deacetylase family protein (PEP-CTERM system associated)
MASFLQSTGQIPHVDLDASEIITASQNVRDPHYRSWDGCRMNQASLVQYPDAVQHRTKQAKDASPRLVNGLSFDVEDWFQTQNYETTIQRPDWQQCEFRAIENTTRILKILERHSVRATFFVLGWVAERAPQIVKMILKGNHEVGSHGFSHRRLKELGPAGFRTDLLQSLDVLAKAGATEIQGFRAPSFSITESESWAFDVLAECGIRYDSSVMPTGLHPDYGIRDAPLSPYKVRDGLWEVPLTVLPVFGFRIPTGGGAYLRLFPYRLTRQMLRRVNQAGRTPRLPVRADR